MSDVKTILYVELDVDPLSTNQIMDAFMLIKGVKAVQQVTAASIEQSLDKYIRFLGIRMTQTLISEANKTNA